MEKEQYMTVGELMRLAGPFAKLMNEMQINDGEDIHDIVSAGLYALGCALAQTGAHIDIEAPVREAVAPLSIGFSEAISNIKKKMM
jgi:hypothetical protein